MAQSGMISRMEHPVNHCAIAALSVLLLLGGCDKPKDDFRKAQAAAETADADRPARDVLRQAAQKMMADPANWKDGSSQLERYITAATRAGIEDRPAVKGFRKAAQEMATNDFVVRRLSEQQSSTAAKTQAQLEAALQARVVAPGAAGGGDANGIATLETQKQFVQQVKESVGKDVSETQLAQFRTDHSALCQCYEDLLVYLRDEIK